MAKIVSTFFTTVDGVVQEPHHWHFPYFDDEMARLMNEAQARQTAFLLGRTLYEEWAGYWPAHLSDDDFGPWIQELPKHVVTHRPLGADPWNNTTAITADHAVAVRELKESTDGEIGMSGCATTVRWLLAEGLLDELHLFVDPIAVGSGRRLFEDGGRLPMTLLGSTALPTGVLHVRYSPL